MTHRGWTWLQLGRRPVIALLLLAACGGEEGALNRLTPSAGAAAPVGAPSPGIAGSIAPSAGAAATGVIVPPTMLMPTQPVMPTQPPEGGVPCDVASVVSKNCTLCHSASARFGAPMPLMKLADFHAESIAMKGKKVYEITPERLNATDIKRRMPPASSTALPATDLSMFTTWLQGGAKAGANACAITDPMAGMPTGMGAAGGGGSENPVAGKPGGMGKASIEPIAYDDPDMKCYKFLAHAQGDKEKPYMKSPGQQYINFSFKAPWTGTMYSRAIKLAIDPNSKVIHHWLLFKTGSVTDGAIATSAGTHGGQDVLLHGWAPGASPIYLDPDLGMKLEQGAGFILEVHYYNDTGSSMPDHSGAEICVTPKKPANEVALSWVGTDSISGTSAQGTCNPRGNTQPIHIIAAQPHMHLKGKHMKVVVNRMGGMK